MLPRAPNIRRHNTTATSGNHPFIDPPLITDLEVDESEIEKFILTSVTRSSVSWNHFSIQLGSLNKFVFLRQFSKALRKLDHVLLWILSINTGLWKCSICAEYWKFQWLAMFCLYTFPLARPAHAKIWQTFDVLWSWFLEHLSHL